LLYRLNRGKLAKRLKCQSLLQGTNKRSFRAMANHENLPQPTEDLQGIPEDQLFNITGGTAKQVIKNIAKVGAGAGLGAGIVGGAGAVKDADDRSSKKENTKFGAAVGAAGGAALSLLRIRR